MTFTGGSSDVLASTVDVFAIGPDGRRQLHARIVAHLQAGGGVAVRGYGGHCRVYDRRHASRFRVDAGGSLHVGRGDSCIDHLAVSFSANFPDAEVR